MSEQITDQTTTEAKSTQQKPRKAGTIAGVFALMLMGLALGSPHAASASSSCCTDESCKAPDTCACPDTECDACCEK